MPTPSTTTGPAKLDLRTFQQELADRLSSKRAGAAEASRLVFVAGEKTWMTCLADSGEVLAVPPITRVPLTQSWYLGIANIRGNLYGIVDFAAFRGGRETRMTPQARLILLGPRFGELKAGLLVDRVIGLRSLAGFELVQGLGDHPAWCRDAWRDEGGSEWREIDLGRLARDAAFLSIGR